METERLTLRPFTADDGDLLVELDSDPAVMRYLNGGAPTPRAVVAEQVLPRFMASYAAGGPFGVWAVVERETGAFLGWVSVRLKPGMPGEASLGYRLRRTAWGRGYATEAARALLAAAFRDPVLRRVTATTYQDNTASRRVMERLGMTLARTFRYDPASVPAGHTTYVEDGVAWDGDDVEYALERAVWERGVARP